MKRVTVITVGRSDYGIYRPILKKLATDSRFQVDLIVSGSHLSGEFGQTASEIREDPYAVRDRIEVLSHLDSMDGMAATMANCVNGFVKSYARERPEILLALGDRIEMHAAVMAALPYHIPVAHIHGGEITEGAIDDSLRHSITKLSHLHFVSTEKHGRRVRQLGEEPWRVHVSGAPSLDSLHQTQYLSRIDLEKRIGISLGERTILVTFHPVTLELEDTPYQIEQLLKALEPSRLQIVFTAANADAHGRYINECIKEFTSRNPHAVFIESLGQRAYFSLLRKVTAMVGNSSSGLIEAPSFELPVLNIGNRQRGRCRAKNVIDCDYSEDSIQAGIKRVTDPVFRSSLAGIINPFGTGQAAEIILNVLHETAVDERLLKKKFIDCI